MLAELLDSMSLPTTEMRFSDPGDEGEMPSCSSAGAFCVVTCAWVAVAVRLSGFLLSCLDSAIIPEGVSVLANLA